MTHINPDFVSPCGLYCGVCAIHIAHRDDNRKLKEKLVNLYKGGTPGKGTLPNSEDLSIDDIRCDGCLAREQFMHCKQCDIKDCVKARGYEGCHQCSDFPCEYIEEFPMTVGKKVILRVIPYRREFGDKKWIEEELARYICPDCGNTVFRGVARCNKCKAQLDLD
jgi:hypothetical protein